MSKNKWLNLAKENYLQSQKIADPATNEIFQIYAEVIEDTETKINALYNKYQTENGLNASQARKYIKGEEYTTWRKSMEKYLKDIAEGGKNSDVAFELNTLAMKSRISREEKLLSQIYREAYSLANVQEQLMNECLEDVLQVTYDRTSKSILNNTNAKFQVYRLNKELVQEILQYPWHKKNFSASVWDNIDDLCFKTKKIIVKGFTAGYSVQQMTKELRKNFEVERFEADRLIRTECRFFANQGELQGYKANGITKYIFKTGQSDNICSRCSTYNNVAIPIEKAEAYVNFPPLHPFCKCFITPYFENSIFGNDKDVEHLENVELSADENHAINTYISSEAYKINDKLRNGLELNKSDERLLKNLDSALDKMDNYEGTVYRSLSQYRVNVDEYLKSYKVGVIKSYPSYISTGEFVFDDSFPIQYVIKSKTGKDLRKYNPEETEILFKRNTKFEVIEIDGNTIYMEERDGREDRI